MSDGQTERFNRTMNAMLSQYVSKEQRDWDLWLPSVLFAYRSAAHSSTGRSPYSMVFGREAKQPIDFQFPIQATKPPSRKPDDHYSALRETLASIHHQARIKLRQAQATQKEYYDRKANAEQFAVGDLVLVYNPVAHGSPKFQKHWEGPYIVVNKPIAGGVTYLLKETTTGKPVTVHRNRLKCCICEPMPEQAVENIEAGHDQIQVAQPVLRPNPAVPANVAPPQQPADVPANVLQGGPIPVPDKNLPTRPPKPIADPQVPQLVLQAGIPALLDLQVAPPILRPTVAAGAEPTGAAHAALPNADERGRSRRQHRAPLRYADEFAFAAARPK